METHSASGRQHESAVAPPAPMTQVERMRAAIAQAVAVAPSFLCGDIDAEHMTKTMVDAVRDCVEQEHAAGGNGNTQNAEFHALQEALAELKACGSGYLAGRCDAACVARTMTQMVHEFAPR